MRRVLRLLGLLTCTVPLVIGCQGATGSTDPLPDPAAVQKLRGAAVAPASEPQAADAATVDASSTADDTEN